MAVNVVQLNKEILRHTELHNKYLLTKLTQFYTVLNDFRKGSGNKILYKQNLYYSI